MSQEPDRIQAAFPSMVSLINHWVPKVFKVLQTDKTKQINLDMMKRIRTHRVVVTFLFCFGSFYVHSSSGLLSLPSP